MNLKFIRRNPTLGQALRDMARHHPRREALIFGEQRITFAQLGQRVEALAAGLHGLGLRRGDKIALVLPNCPEFVYAAFAAADLGAAAVPISVQSGAREIQHILNDAEAAAVVTDVKAPGTDLLALIESLRPELPHLKHVIVRGQALPGALGLDDLLHTATAAYPGPAAEPPDPAMILYTSGTTGAPKGAVHSHRTLILAVRIMVAKFVQSMGLSWRLVKQLPRHLKTVRRLPWLVEAMLSRRDLVQLKLLVLTPFYHVAGYFQLVLGLLTGDKLVVMERFHPDRAMELIARERVTLVFGAPPMFQAMLARPGFEQYDLSSIVLAIAGTMPVPPQLIQEMETKIGGFCLVLYGATEMAVTTLTTPGALHDRQAGTVGRADYFDQVEVKIVDEARRPVPPGQVGEIAVRAPSLMEGYYKRPEATAQAIDADGWYYTGDMGAIDPEGYVQVLGRRGDMIIRAGANIYPAEIEHFLLTHPGVEQVAVVGVPGPAASGEKVRAYVVPKAGAELEAGDVLGYCWGQIAAYKVPDEVVFVDSLPVTSALQKVQHYKLRAEAIQEMQKGP